MSFERLDAAIGRPVSIVGWMVSVLLIVGLAGVLATVFWLGRASAPSTPGATPAGASTSPAIPVAPEPSRAPPRSGGAAHYSPDLPQPATSPPTAAGVPLAHQQATPSKPSGATLFDAGGRRVWSAWHPGDRIHLGGAKGVVHFDGPIEVFIVANTLTGVRGFSGALWMSLDEQGLTTWMPQYSTEPPPTPLRVFWDTVKTLGGASNDVFVRVRVPAGRVAEFDIEN